MGLATTSLSEESRGSAQKMHAPPSVASTSGGSGDFCGGNGADDALQDEVLFELPNSSSDESSGDEWRPSRGTRAA